MTSPSIGRRQLLELLAAGPLMTAASSFDRKSANPQVGKRGGILNALSTAAPDHPAG